MRGISVGLADIFIRPPISRPEIHRYIQRKIDGLGTEVLGLFRFGMHSASGILKTAEAA